MNFKLYQNFNLLDTAILARNLTAQIRKLPKDMDYGSINKNSGDLRWSSERRVKYGND